MTRGLELAVAFLMNDVLQAMNNTHMNASVVMEGIQRSVEQTMQAVQQVRLLLLSLQLHFIFLIECAMSLSVDIF